jgi:hypothetical protein
LFDLAEAILGTLNFSLSGIGLGLFILSSPVLMGFLGKGGATISPVLLRGGGEFMRSDFGPPLYFFHILLLSFSIDFWRKRFNLLMFIGSSAYMIFTLGDFLLVLKGATGPLAVEALLGDSRVPLKIGEAVLPCSISCFNFISLSLSVFSSRAFIRSYIIFY